MPWRSDPELWSALPAVILAAISGLIAIARKVSAGQVLTFSWAVSQLGASILVGYAVWDAYPYFAEYIPSWCTRPMVVIVTAHYASRFMALVEKFITLRLGLTN